MKHNSLTPSFMLFLFGVAVLMAVAFEGCKSNIPPIDVTFWAGDSANEGITRSQEQKTISCKDPAFDDYVAMKYADLQKIYDTLLQCKVWNVPTMNVWELQVLMWKNQEAFSHVEFRIPKKPPAI